MRLVKQGYSVRTVGLVRMSAFGLIPIMLFVAVERSNLCHLDDWFGIGELFAGIELCDDGDVLTLNLNHGKDNQNL